MARFMVEASLRVTPDVEALYPAQAAKVNEHMARGVRGESWVAADRSKVWFLYMAESLEDVEALLGELPLRAAMTVEITPLL